MNCLEAYKYHEHQYKTNQLIFGEDNEYTSKHKFEMDIFNELTEHCIESVDNLHKFFIDYEMIIRLLGKWTTQLKQEGSNSKGMVLNDMIFYLGVLTGE